MSNSSSDNFVLILILVVAILYVFYFKKQEGFNNKKKMLHNNYKDFMSHSSPPWVQKEETMDEVQYILLKVVELINGDTNKEFYIGNIDTVSKNEIENKTINYLVDLFLYEKTDNFTIKIIINFTVDKNNDVVINTITKSNANYYNFDLPKNTKTKTQNNICIIDKIDKIDKIDNIDNIDKIDKIDKINIKGFENIVLPHSLYDGNIIKEVTTPLEFKKDFIPLMIQEDLNYKKLKIHSDQKKKMCNNKQQCWDCDGVLNRDPQFCSCDSINNFKREGTPIIEQPSFTSTIHKLVSEHKENDWLFKPTRVEIDHNY